MPKYKFYQCPDCDEQIKGKRHLFEHMVNEHGYKDTIHAISRFYNEELNENGHFYCHECGKEIPDDKVIQAIIDKGKNFVSRYCSLLCQKRGTIKENSKIAHRHLREEMYKRKHIPGYVSKYDSFIQSGKRTWERAKSDPELYERLNKGLEIGRKYFLGGLNKYYTTDYKCGRLYMVKAQNRITKETCWKIGIGNPWRRWKCICMLMPDWDILEMWETPNPLRGIDYIEYQIHRSLKKPFGVKWIPNICKTFKQGDYIFQQSTGYTEWFSEGAEFYAKKILKKKFHMELRSSLSGFNKYMKEDDIELIE